MGDSRRPDAMSASGMDVEGAARAPVKPRGRELVRLTAQAAVAIACAAAVSRVAWGLVGDQLSLRTDIVGSTIFDDFDIYHYLDHFYILAVLLPGLAAGLYLLLVHWGPLASRGPRPPWPPFLSQGSDAPASLSSPPETSPDTAPPSRLAPAPVKQAVSPARLIGVAARLALPALVIAVECEVGILPSATTLSVPVALAALAAYLAAVAVVAAWSRMGLAAWAAANAVLATAVVPMLLLVSAGTTVSIASDHRLVHYPWLPVWLALAATLLVLVLIAVSLRRGGWQAGRRAERLVLLAVVAPVALFLVTAVFQSADASFIGYDDTMPMTGAHLLFAEGLLPWRDVFLLHGFFTDALYGQVGMWAFGATAWASNSGLSFFIGPVTVISLYAFIVYFARRNYALVLAGSLAVVLGLVLGWPETRFLLLPPALILFDSVLRRASWTRCFALMAVLYLTAIATPESLFLVGGILATLVLAELVHHRWAEPLRQGFPRTLRCGIAGASLTAVWLAYLIATGSLSGFIQYYLSLAAGHELWGALPIQWPLSDIGVDIEFGLPLALFLLTVARLAWKIGRRTPWRTVDWVLVASATFVPLYYQEAIDRLDSGHVDVLFQALTPLVLLWGYELVATADTWSLRVARAIRAAMSRRRVGSPVDRTERSTWSTWPSRSIAPAGLIAVACMALLAPQSLSTWANLPADFHASSPTEPPAGLPLGYTNPGALDTTQLEDLATVLNRYAGPTAPVFDFTNEPGVTYFLLNRVPAAPFYHIGAAQTVAAQQLEVSALKRSSPPVVIFNDVTFGLPDYDGISSMEREFLVSQYILDNYQPILDVQGQLIMLRDDLVSTAPAAPALKVPPITTGLYFADVMGCDWGGIPDFFDPPAQSEIDSGQAATTMLSTQTVTSGAGWAFDGNANRAATAVLAVSGGIVVGETQTMTSRPDVAAALKEPSALMTGWALSAVSTTEAPVTFYDLNADGTATPIASSIVSAPTPSIEGEGGTVYDVVDASNSGHVDVMQTGTVLKMSVPQSTTLTAYQWLEFQSPSGFGQASIQVTDHTLGTQPSHLISFQTLPGVGRTVYVRVGSCIQWHGYQASDLHLVVQGAPQDMSVRLLP